MKAQKTLSFVSPLSGLPTLSTMASIPPKQWYAPHILLPRPNIPKPSFEEMMFRPPAMVAIEMIARMCL